MAKYWQFGRGRAAFGSKKTVLEELHHTRQDAYTGKPPPPPPRSEVNRITCFCCQSLATWQVF